LSHSTTRAEITELEALRKRSPSAPEKAGAKLTMTAILLKVVAAALKVFPKFNSSIDMASRRSCSRNTSTSASPWIPSAACSCR